MSAPEKIEIIPLCGFPLLEGPTDLGREVSACLEANHLTLRERDVLVLAHKIVSKAEGRVVVLSAVTPSARALTLAEQTGKEPELVEVILAESKRVVRQAHGVLICENALGLFCANAGVDRSNAGDDSVVLLPQDPDASARALRRALRHSDGVDVAVLVADTHGRPWREGAVGLCLGMAGMEPFLDYRGHQDLYDYEMQTEMECVADELCAAGTLVMGQGSEGIPLALVRGFSFSADERATSQALLRDPARDLFR